MKLAAVFVALVTVASGGFQGLAPLRAAVFTTGLQAPVAFVADPSDPSIFYAVEQGGRIRVVRNRVVAEDFLDLRTATVGSGERGLLGMALAPDFPSSGRFYVNFTNTNGDTVVARFKRSNGTVDPASRFDLKWGPERSPVILQPFVNHNGGHLAFGPDGYLYIGLGDGGSGDDPGRRAQDPSTLLGKMLRIDVVNVSDDHPNGYVVPADNPFLKGTPVAALPEIWSFGWRNPWRYSFDPVALGGTGALVAADVGQNNWEEIDYEPRGAGGRNYGWRIREGAQLNPNRCRADPCPRVPAADRSHPPVQPLGGTVDQRWLRLSRHGARRRLPRAVLLRRLRAAAGVVARVEPRAWRRGVRCRTDRAHRGARRRRRARQRQRLRHRPVRGALHRQPQPRRRAAAVHRPDGADRAEDHSLIRLRASRYGETNVRKLTRFRAGLYTFAQ